MFVGFAQIASFTVEAKVETDMTVYPQKLELNCLKVGHAPHSFNMILGNKVLADCGTDTSPYCPESMFGNNTVIHVVNLIWNGVTISSPNISHLSVTGDQHYQCTVSVPGQPSRIRNVTIRGNQL